MSRLWRVCDANHCMATTHPSRGMCTKHWRMVPLAIQQRIYAAARKYRTSAERLSSSEFLEAWADAVEHVARLEGRLTRNSFRSLIDIAKALENRAGPGGDGDRSQRNPGKDMNSKEPTAQQRRFTDAFNVQLRLDAVADLASAVATDAFDVRRVDGPLGDFMDWLVDQAAKQHPSTQVLGQLVRTHRSDMEELGAVLHRRGYLGLACLFRSPVKAMHPGDQGGYSYSWGYTQGIWVYAHTVDEAWNLGMAWARECEKRAVDGARELKA